MFFFSVSLSLASPPPSTDIAHFSINHSIIDSSTLITSYTNIIHPVFHLYILQSSIHPLWLVWYVHPFYITHHSLHVLLHLYSDLYIKLFVHPSVCPSCFVWYIHPFYIMYLYHSTQSSIYTSIHPSIHHNPSCLGSHPPLLHHPLLSFTQSSSDLFVKLFALQFVHPSVHKPSIHPSFSLPCFVW